VAESLYLFNEVNFEEGSIIEKEKPIFFVAGDGRIEAQFI
jgi:hypothetical protein